MARTAVLTKEQLIQCALDLVNQHGFESITMRLIAKQLGTSTAPIYTQYPTMEALYQDLSDYVMNKLLEYTQISYTPDSFLNIGVGILAFVLENKEAYAYYFLSPNRLKLPVTTPSSPFLAQLKAHPFLSILGEERLTSLLYDMSIYTYGLSSMICTGVEESTNLNDYLIKLQQAGNKLISYHLFSSGKYETYIETLMQKIGQHINLEEVLKT
jgi:AcrR family transcriptional regulator